MWWGNNARYIRPSSDDMGRKQRIQMTTRRKSLNIWSPVRLPQTSLFFNLSQWTPSSLWKMNKLFFTVLSFNLLFPALIHSQNNFEHNKMVTWQVNNINYLIIFSSVNWGQNTGIFLISLLYTLNERMHVEP